MAISGRQKLPRLRRRSCGEWRDVVEAAEVADVREWRVQDLRYVEVVGEREKASPSTSLLFSFSFFLPEITMSL